MKANDEKIRKFIGNSDTVFIIPPFQRNYSWDTEQCSELFDDILASIKKRKSHYIGNIVYYVGENDRAGLSEYILVDGQQRITSILLLLCAIRDRLPYDEANRLENKFLINEHENNEKYRVKLKQTDNDSEVFEKIINKNQLFDEEKSNKLYENYSFFVDKLAEMDEEQVVDFYNAIADLDIVDLNLKIEHDLEAVQKIFEKINSTGKPLSVADLIRNYLLISCNSSEQNRLYNTYWINIEKLYKDKEKISDFAKHYLITKRFIFIEEKRMYNTFKLYFDKSNINKEEILKEILKLSKYYNWFIDEECPNEKVNIIIKELNVLKSDDMYSLLLVLFDKLYVENISELIDILNLLCDFMIRYRIVSPTNGSGDIRKTLFTLLSKISKNDIVLNYTNILYELSNSPSPGGRFPDNNEFKEALNNYVNTSYAKALLYKLEYKEAKNIEVDIRKVTVEHLMPQTLSDDWKRYLGGKDKALLIYNTYINNIGNLALLSRPMNSENSNAIWDIKKNNVKDAQFVLTNSIDKNCEWGEDSILKRCEYITNLALKYITGPLDREKDYESLEVTDNYIAGVYNASDITFEVTGRNAKTIIFNNVPYNVKGWYELVAVTCKLLHDYDNTKIEKIIKENRIHKSTFKTSYYFGKDPIICYEKKYLLKPYYIENANCYVEANLSANRSMFYTLELINEYGLIDKFKIEIE